MNNDDKTLKIVISYRNSERRPVEMQANKRKRTFHSLNTSKTILFFFLGNNEGTDEIPPQPIRDELEQERIRKSARLPEEEDAGQVPVLDDPGMFSSPMSLHPVLSSLHSAETDELRNAEAQWQGLLRRFGDISSPLAMTDADWKSGDMFLNDQMDMDPFELAGIGQADLSDLNDDVTLGSHNNDSL